MESTKSYYLYELQEKYTGQDWMPVIPRTYSIDGNGTMPRILKSENEEVCSGSVQPTPPTHDYSLDYLTIESLEDNNTIYWYGSSGFSRTISASTDNGVTWTEYTSTSGGTSIAYLNTGEKVLLKGLNDKYFPEKYASYSYGDGCKFKSARRHSVYGNIMSLVDGDNFSGSTSMASRCFRMIFDDDTGLVSAENLVLPATTLGSWCYQNMFSNCTRLTKTPELPATTLVENCYNGMFRYCSSLTTAPELPATTLAQSCYETMFNGCTSLTTTPELPATTLAVRCYEYMFAYCTSLTTAQALSATTLAESCYYQMFQGCTSLTTAPELPATTLASDCYSHMFFNCTSLTTAPVLPAKTLANGCYINMFRGCTNLNSITCLATNISAFQCTTNWVNGVASSGTFTKAASMRSWTTGANGIPSGWTVQNA